ncbi:glycosyltransferase [Photobacterium leiognathi]|uniref:glycosyltransferase n=1 Tax=Photobacterium leiognathi TaxID=553611 RepID=UPI00076AB648|nr:glycosyltransferase [Photobacterium leiognathi]
MNILLIRQSLHSGGAERVVVELANRMVEEGHSVDVYLTENIIKYKLDSRVQVVHSSISEFIRKLEKKLLPIFGNLTFLITSIFHVYFLKKDISINNYDKTYIHSLSSLLRFQYLFGKNIYAVYHCSKSDLLLKNRNFFQKIKNKLSLKMTSIFKNKIAVSKGVGKDLKEHFYISVDRVIYNPFDFDFICNESYDFLESDFVNYGSYILNVGRLQEQKNQKDLILAFSKLTHKFDSLILLGTGPDEKMLKKLVKDLNIDSQVFFMGHSSNPYKYMRNASLFVLSSNYEGFGNVIVESLACQCPVISSNCNYGPDEILLGSLSQWLYKCNDIEDLVNKCLTIDNNYNFLDAKLERFSYSKSVNDYING